MEKERFIEQIVPLRPKLLEYANSYVKDRQVAEDIVQEVLMKLYEIRSTLSNYKNINALSFTITKHLSINKMRDNRSKFNSQYDSNISVDNTLTPYSSLEVKDDVEHVMRIIDKLPNLQQATLKMRHIEGLTIDEIAELTGCTPEAVRVNISRARKSVVNYFFKLK